MHDPAAPPSKAARTLSVWRPLYRSIGRLYISPKWHGTLIPVGKALDMVLRHVSLSHTQLLNMSPFDCDASIPRLAVVTMLQQA
jgi:hypothetical protein